MEETTHSPENPQKKLLRNPQNIIALGVTIISACALIVSILQTQIMMEQRGLMHEQAKASVWPRVSLSVWKAHEPEFYKITDYSLVISNEGVGPAIIKGVRVSYEDKVVKNWWELFQNFQLADSIQTYIGNTSLNHSILKIGEERKVLNLSGNLPLAQVYFEHSKKIKIEIFYESIYGDKWKITHTAEGEFTEELASGFDFEEVEQFEN